MKTIEPWHLSKNTFMVPPKPIAAVLLIFMGLFLIDARISPKTPIPVAPQLTVSKTENHPNKTSKAKIQAAILLDVSGSMEGLIEQAKAQLWNMVSVMGKAKCADGDPQIEIALYEYGRSSNDVSAGYIKLISGFTKNLDSLSQELFKLRTNGGDEYCGQVIYTSLNQLSWDAAPENYKVIFIAGNEDFLQGSVQYSLACAEAKKKGVIVNTIYCGDRESGIREHWNLGGECGQGNYSNIDHNQKPADIPTPYDSTLMVLNDKLNQTYVYYGSNGSLGYATMLKADQDNKSMNRSVAAKRVAVKANGKVYNNPSWELVDAYKADSTFIEKVKTESLPESLKGKSKKEITQIVENMNNQRSGIQLQIDSVSKKREEYIVAEKKKNVNNSPTLESEIEKIIKMQGKRFKMLFD